MTMMTLRDYAKKNNISYEAVRKQVVRYQKELAGHLIKDGRQQFLDEEAVAFLDAKRKKNPVAIYQMDKDEQIERLENENKQLLVKLNAVQDALLKEREKTKLLDEKTSQIARLEADNEAAREKISLAEKDAQKAQKELVGAKEAYEADLRTLTEKKMEEVSKGKREVAEAVKRAELAEAELIAYKALPWYKKIFG